MSVLRIILVALSLLACAWFGLGIRQAHDTNRAIALINSSDRPSPAQTHRILSMLDAAGELNPDRTVAELRSEAYTRAGSATAAVAVMRRVVADQPQDVGAWVVLGFAARQSDPALAALADRRRRELAPAVPAR